VASFTTGDMISAVEERNEIPTEFKLFQNYPNTFWNGATSPALGGGKPTTTISFSLPKRSEVRLVLVNVLGKAWRAWMAEGE
jgi:hypothetical protein